MIYLRYDFRWKDYKSLRNLLCSMTAIWSKRRKLRSKSISGRLQEIPMTHKTLSKTACKRRAKENQKIYMWHPVHYLISAGDWGAAKDMYELLIAALTRRMRLWTTAIHTARKRSIPSRR